MDVFYFTAKYGFDMEQTWEEREEHGFLIAEDFNQAMNWVTKYYGDDLLSVKIEVIGDTGFISTENKEVAEAFKKSYLKTHYGEDAE